MPEKKAAAKKAASVEFVPEEPVEEAEPVAGPAEEKPAEAGEVPQPDPASVVPEPETKAGGYVNKAGYGWVLEEES